jgi:DNA sulfur modification protein DndD
MLIRTLSIRDFGLYRGETVLDLGPRRKYGRVRPIILFGGKNGAGKSTILEAIKLCLYGRASLGERVRASDYGGYLAGKIHRSVDGDYMPQSAELALEFEHVDVGVKSEYVVRRGWRKSDSQHATESVIVTRNGEPLNEVDADHWNEFIRDLVPPGLAELCFFDGEKIQRLAETGADSELADAVRSLLGLNLVDRLQGDLDIYLSRSIKQHGGAVLHGRVEQVEGTLRELEAAVEQICQAAAAARSELDNAGAQASKCRAEISRTGGVLATNRFRLEAERDHLSAEIKKHEEELRELSTGLLPFALCHELCDVLEVELSAPSDSRGDGSRVLECVEGVIEAFRDGGLPVASSLPADMRAACADELAVAVSTSIELSAPPDRRSPIVDTLSPVDISQLITWIGGAREIRKRLPHVSRALTTFERRLRLVHRQLAQVPDEDVVGPLVASLADHEKTRGALEERIARYEAEQQDLEYRITVARRQLAKVSEEITGHDEWQQRVEQVRNVKAAFAAYHKVLVEHKVRALEREVGLCFRRLSRKSDLVHGLSIDPTTFEVTLRTRGGTIISRELLSAGEKQVFAISMLWALARTSGRALPIVVDTPLARLDRDHRRLLFERYFPAASHQVIILSTDTEFDESAFELLQPSISHAYHLVYEDGLGRSEAQEGYFWKAQHHVATEAPANSILN